MGEAKHRVEASKPAIEARIGEILNEFLDRKAAGERVSEADLLAQHPELAAELKAHLELLRDIEPTRAAVSELLDRGILARPTDGQYAAELGPFKIMGLLGRGGMGVVLKAYDSSLYRFVALKLLRAELAGDRTALARFEREAKAAAALQHPNIVTLHAIGEEQGTHYLVMEYIAGPTLASVVRNQGALPVETARSIFRQLLSGLAAAHDFGLIHRDIKSSNILLQGDEPQVKIADFGLARVLTSETRVTLTGSVFGTPEYMSPEQARGDGNIDRRSDLYSAGVVLYEMLTGRPPFKAESGSAVIHQILYDDPPDPRTFYKSADPRLSTLALRLMAKRPEDRFASAAEAIAVLDSGKRVRVPTKTRWLDRRRLVAAMTVAVWAVLAVWGTSRLWPAPLEEVAFLDADGQPTHVLQARYGENPDWKVLFRFPQRANRIVGAERVDADGHGDRIVVAGIEEPWDGNCLFGISRSGRILWRLDMSDDAFWPDCNSPGKWRARAVHAANVDGVPGDEVIAAAIEPGEYPSRISIVEPRTGVIRSTFWHQGQFAGIRIVRDFFGQGHPAIVAWGPNNKLDGFGDPPPRPYTPRPGEDPPVTKYGIVHAAMILDPRDMKGCGPPRAPQLPHHGKPPLAYAFLDLPATEHSTYVDRFTGQRVLPAANELTVIDKVSEVACPPGQMGPCLRIHIGRVGSTSGAMLTVDRNLSALEATIAGAAEDGITPAYWMDHWKPIVQDGHYVAQP